MDLYVLDEGYQAIAVIDDYRSLIWAKRYIEFGDCELYVRACDEYIDVLRKGRFLCRNDDDMVCRIRSIQLETSVDEGNFLIITGQDCRWILSQRVVWRQTNFTGLVEDYVRMLLDENAINPTETERDIPNLFLGAKAGLTARISEQVTYAQLDEKIIELCQAYQYGSKMYLDGNDHLIFEMYEGKDRSYNQDENDFVVFSPEFDNIISSVYITDDSNLKNVALVAGEGEGVLRKRETVGTASGLDRYELFVDARDVSSETEEGVTIDYGAILKSKGVEALAEYGTTISFEGEVEPNHSYKYGVDYMLGDIVQVMNEYGIETCARITEVIETFDENGYSVIPTFQYQEAVTDDD